MNISAGSHFPSTPCAYNKLYILYWRGGGVFFIFFNSLAPQKQSSQQSNKKTLAREKLSFIQQQREGEIERERKEAICYLELMKYETLFVIFVFHYSASWWLGWNSIFGVKREGRKERDKKEEKKEISCSLFVCLSASTLQLKSRRRSNVSTIGST